MYISIQQVNCYNSGIMKDSYGREINYIRISLTDRCNLRCIYCMPEGVELVPREEILREQEILEIAGAAARLGISHVKLTGGEPLVRRCCRSLIREMKQVPGIETVTLTTNGVLLKENLESLKESGIDGINVSLDTADPDLYRKITGGGDVSVVTDAIRASVDAGIRTKINAVALSEENEALLEFARDYPVDVRFIEIMPIGYGTRYPQTDNRKILEAIWKDHPDIEKDPSKHGFGPAVYYQIPGFRGAVGFISAIHGKFCGSCNRVRLTSMGYLKTCLCYEDGTDLRKIVRDENLTQQEKEERLAEAIREAILRKPEAHCFDDPGDITEKHLMASIGG